jgi:carbamoyltransferase
MTAVLGISAYFHDSAAALVCDGAVVAACQEERFSRVKSDASFPVEAVKFCLERERVTAFDLDAVVFYEDPKLKLMRQTQTALRNPKFALRLINAAYTGDIDHPMRRSSMRTHIASVVGVASDRVKFVEHHYSHAASAFYPSPFDHAAILCIDGVGEMLATSIWHGAGKHIKLIDSFGYPNSLGLLYSAFTYFCGFRPNSGECKLMGLAPYGVSRYMKDIQENFLHLRSDGSYQVRYRAFGRCFLASRVEDALSKVFQVPRRKPESPIEQVYCDIAASIQSVIELAISGLAKRARMQTGCSRLCMAGGVALNCVANTRVAEQCGFDEVWVQPAAGDAGGALGAAYAESVRLGQPLHRSGYRDGMQGSMLGPEFTQEEVRRTLQISKLQFHEIPQRELLTKTAELLDDGAVVGWFQGRSEYGPRALGSRSVIGDPRRPDMQRKINLKIKYRESFRPFAPAVLAERCSDYFDIASPSPYMLTTGQAKDFDCKSSLYESSRLPSVGPVTTGLALPAVTHVDGSARVQIVDDRYERFRSLLQYFEKRTGCPVLINTSMNVRGEPIVNSPEDAVEFFKGTCTDCLVVEGFLVLRSEQSESVLLAARPRLFPAD